MLAARNIMALFTSHSHCFRLKEKKTEATHDYVLQFTSNSKQNNKKIFLLQYISFYLAVCVVHCVRYCSVITENY